MRTNNEGNLVRGQPNVALSNATVLARAVLLNSTRSLVFLLIYTFIPFIYSLKTELFLILTLPGLDW